VTPIDTIYEYAGFRLAGAFQGLLDGVGLPVLVGLGGMAYLVYSFMDRGSPKDLGVYLLQLVFLGWLLSPAEVQGMRAPRFAVWLVGASDVLQKRVVGAVNAEFLAAPFEWERVAAMAGFAQVLDPVLGRDLDRFLEDCARPALARSAPRGPNVLRGGTLDYPPACEKRRKALWQGLHRHVREHPSHRAALEAVRRRDPAQAAEFEERYLDRMAARALEEGADPAGESARVLATLGEYSWTDPAQSTGGMPGYVKALGSGLNPWMAPVYWIFGDRLADGVISAVAQFHQAWENRFSARQRYYLVTVYGPHLYGLALMLVVGLFPVVGMFALLPGKWRALVNYGKVLVSVKLWPVLWAVLSSFNARRSSLEAFGPDPRGSVDVALAVASMYLLVPAVAYLVVHLAVSASAVPFTPAVPPPSGPGLGAAGPALGAARAAASLAA